LTKIILTIVFSRYLILNTNKLVLNISNKFNATTDV